MIEKIARHDTFSSGFLHVQIKRQTVAQKKKEKRPNMKSRFFPEQGDARSRSLSWRIASSAFLLFISICLAGVLDAQPLSRIARTPDDSRTVRVVHTTHPAVGFANDLGRAADTLRMDRMLLQLQSSPEQEAALEQLLADQEDPSSPRYRKWLTPEEFGEQFGVTPHDLDVITAWLGSHNFSVTEVAAGRRSIEFGGTALQVERAFHTEMHNYELNGQRHIANATDISIPEELSGVVAGVVSLHDFHSKPLHHLLPPASGGPVGLTTLSDGTHGISPYDFATIYNVSPLWNTSYDGTGQSVAVVGRTNIQLSDVSAFRSKFGLPVNTPQIIVNGQDPGDLGGGDEIEADLDVEWSGSVARGAAVKFVVSASTASTDGIVLSSQYIVNKNVAPVMTLSFGTCEAYMGSSNQFFSSLWKQASTEGISVFVAAGDTGSAGCDMSYSINPAGQNITSPASQGLGINGLASTPYNVAVGGTEFNDTAGSWSASNSANYASATGYIPEMVWNESNYTGAGPLGNNLLAGGGGVSIVYGRPSWQAGTGNRQIPDVSFAASLKDGYLVEQGGLLHIVGGTSASAPSFAGLMAIVDQYAGGRNGNPNSVLYSLAASAPYVYHDIVTGNNEVPCSAGSPDCSATTAGAIGHMNGFSAGPGYDMATGLGSVDAYALAANWHAQVSPSPKISSVSPNPMTGSNAPQTLTISGSGFQSGLTVKAGSVSYTSFTSISSTQITLNVIVGTIAQPLAVQVINPGNKASNTVIVVVVAPDDSSFVIQSVPVTIKGSQYTMKAGQLYNVSMTFKNTGAATWTSAGGYKLVSQRPTNFSTTWGISQIDLPAPVASGGEVTFNFTITAPKTPGLYHFEWVMEHNAVNFGDFSPDLPITITQ
jgi:pseudomonalisin